MDFGSHSDLQTVMSEKQNDGMGLQWVEVEHQSFLSWQHAEQRVCGSVYLHFTNVLKFSPANLFIFKVLLLLITVLGCPS